MSHPFTTANVTAPANDGKMASDALGGDMVSPASPDITVLLRAWRDGDSSALDQLMEVTYPELHRIALRYVSRDRPDHTLQCTALLHEAYLRLAHSPGKDWNDRSHFFGFASRLMRNILVDYARARQTEKRGVRKVNLTIVDVGAATQPPEVEILDLNYALEELETVDPFQSRVVELRYFGGLSIDETAELEGVSVSTVKREWIMAKTWIRRRLLQTDDSRTTEPG
jgi:RNA polymerase sigma factor (TIGR02999 family)